MPNAGDAEMAETNVSACMELTSDGHQCPLSVRSPANTAQPAEVPQDFSETELKPASVSPAVR